MAVTDVKMPVLNVAELEEAISDINEIVCKLRADYKLKFKEPACVTDPEVSRMLDIAELLKDKLGIENMNNVYRENILKLQVHADPDDEVKAKIEEWRGTIGKNKPLIKAKGEKMRLLLKEYKEEFGKEPEDLTSERTLSLLKIWQQQRDADCQRAFVQQYLTVHQMQRDANRAKANFVRNLNRPS